MAEIKLYDLAKVIRSKNSGPFSITLDVLFDRPDIYRHIKESGIITRERIAGLYHIRPDMITELVFFDAALGFKITYDRSNSSGTALVSDVYGAQQHAPLGELLIDLAGVEEEQS